MSIIILPPPPELQLREGCRHDAAEEADDYPDWRQQNRRRDARADAFPELCATEGPEALAAKLYGYSGSVETRRYARATKFSDMAGLDWSAARVALNRLVRWIHDDRRNGPEAAHCVALAEFALTARGFDFAGLKGESAPRFRKERTDAVRTLAYRLLKHLQSADERGEKLTRPLAEMWPVTERWPPNQVLDATVPLAADRWVRVTEATGDQALASLSFLRATWAAWCARRPTADDVRERLDADAAVTALEYAEALHIGAMLEFTGERLVTLLNAMRHSMPIYRRFPHASEQDAVAAWWPWGPAMAGGPPRPSGDKATKLDPSIITATKPADVIREVMEKLGVSRVLAGKLTKDIRATMRRERKATAREMLWQGVPRAEVAKAVGISPSRLGEIFKGRKFAQNRRRMAVLAKTNGG